MSLSDERVRFYLRHSERIEEWAALRKEAAQAVDEWLMHLQPDLEALAADLGREVRLHAEVGPDHQWPRFRLLRPGWPESDEQPGACIALEWERRSTVLRGEYAPYLGVRCLRGDPRWSRLRALTAFEEVRAKRKERTGQFWAAWGYVAPEGDIVGAEDRYRARLLGSLAGAWRSYAALIDEAGR